MSAFLMEIIMAVAGAALIVAGWLLSKEWQKRVLGLVGILLVMGALMSVLMDLSTSFMWGTVEVPEGDQEYQPGTLIPELVEGVPIAGLEGSIQVPVQTEGLVTPPWTPEPVPSVPFLATPLPLPSSTPWATDTPRATDTPGPPTLTPTATDTARPVPIDATPVTVVPLGSAEVESTASTAASASAEPTRTSKPEPTPGPDQRRLSLKKLDAQLRGVALTNVTQDTQRIIFELGGRERYNPIYSAAWSPNGQRVVISYGWLTSEYDQGIRLQVVNDDGSGARDILSLTTAGEYRGLGNALWTPAGDKIIFAFHDGPDDGVWEINPDGSGLRRLGSSVPGEWPRYWTVDGAWLITISGDGALYALEVGGDRRLPLSSIENPSIFDPRYHPWRTRAEPRCEQQEESWWKCK